MVPQGFLDLFLDLPHPRDFAQHRASWVAVIGNRVALAWFAFETLLMLL